MPLGAMAMQSGNLAATFNRMKGRDRIGTVQVEAEAQQVDLSNIGFQGTRFNTIAQRYEQVLFHTVRVHFIPTASKTQAGTITMCPNYDVSDPPMDTAVTIMGNAGAVTAPICENSFVTFTNPVIPGTGMTATPPLFWSPNEPRFSSIGTVNYIIEGTGEADDTVIGYFDIDYDVTFIRPVLEQSLHSWTAASTVSPLTVTAGTTTPAYPNPYYQYTSATVPTDLGCYLAQAVNGNPDRVYTGIIDALSGVTLETRAGDGVDVGTRVFWKLATNEAVAAGVQAIQAGTDLIGGLSLWSSFEDEHAIGFTTAGAGNTISLRNCMYMS